MQADAGKPCKHFHPAFRDCDPSLTTASSLFMAFAFRKPPAPVPAAPLTAAPAAEDDGAASQPEPAASKNADGEQQHKVGEKRAAPAAPMTKRPTIRRRGGKPIEKLPDGDQPPAS